MIETMVTVAIVLAAGVWFFLWLRGMAKGENGCACGGCGKKCASREGAGPDHAGGEGHDCCGGH